ncbi:hypothetical protein FEM48_Zijuj02G0163000 [Ziziphus jujuba var. spinosa]|uniref:NADP-dependent oxidoreductase domain-containing protein n=1 Tax=Ziziphus jujuba var. spinosa TaxID=714518 RepID=A0A978VWP2_ZIZJJ|nr:hypothetical protein FEM48_Zijuj02G0163000 [Ziziphus jujuba var. spinosa]
MADNHRVQVPKVKQGHQGLEVSKLGFGVFGMDCIDLCHQHQIDTSVPIEETIGELKKFVEEGKLEVYWAI